MRIWSQQSTDPQDVAVLLFPRFSNHCLANAVEPLRGANTLLSQPSYRWQFVTLDGAPVESSGGLPVLPNCRLRDHSGGKFLFVMSSYDAPQLADAATAAALRTAAARFECVVGLDTGTWLMAHAGMLNGRKATIHWDELMAFSESFPEVDAVAERYVIEEDRISCGGAMTAFDLVLELIARTHGEALRLEVSSFFLHQSRSAPNDLGLRHTPVGPVAAALDLMSEHIEEPLAIPAVAARLKMSQRTLARLFQAEVGASPMTVYKRLRLAAARRYAQHSRYSVAEIALRCGYRNASAMTRAYVEEFGSPIGSFRRSRI